jgi:hypothetical protein
MKNPHQKGSTFERKVCTDLSLWSSGGKRDDLFWRSSLSGGRATVRFSKGKATKNQYGDIVAIDPEGFWFTDIFIAECKHYKDLGLVPFLFGKGFIWKTWDKLIRQCHDHNRAPFLILRQNNYPILLALHSDDFCRDPYFRKEDICFYDFKFFLKHISPHDIKEICAPLI